MMSFKLLSLSIYIALSWASAIPGVQDLPKVQAKEVIPGPGLPSLESLGLTSEDLYKITPNLLAPLAARGNNAVLQKRFLMCYDYRRCNWEDAVACYNYLNSLGTQDCVATGGVSDGVRFCTAGGCGWNGYNFSPDSYASSHCRDVALGGWWAIEACTTSDRQVQGENAAAGNGYLQVDMYQTW